MEEWRKYKLGDIVSIKGGKRLPKGVNLISTPNNHPYIRVRDLGNSKYIELNHGYEYVDEKTQKLISRYIVNAGDILISIVGTIGLVGKVGESLSYANLTENCVKLVDLNCIDGDFLYYYLKSTVGQYEIAKGTVGAVQAKLPIKNIQNISILLPPLDVQRRISETLSSLDDKIALNTRINNNLEQQAQALYKSWFVDFEPFKGGKFIDSELGEIPEGWRVGTISDVIISTLSGDWGKEFEMGSYTQKVFCIRGADIPDIKMGNNGKMPSRYILPKNFDNKALTNNDIVVEISGGSPTQSTGRVCRITDELLDKHNNTLICTNFCRAIKPQKDYSQYIYYCWANIYENGIMFSYENGTTGIKNLDISGFIEKEPILIPSQDTVSEFSLNIDAFNRHIIRNSLENEKLSAIRDSLLPKLMSGELKIGDLNS